MIYQVSIFKAPTGRGVSDLSSNNYFVRTGAEVNTTPIRDLIIHLHDIEQQFMLDDWQFSHGIARAVLNDDHSPASGRYRKVGFEDFGSRVSVGDSAEIELCLVVNREVDEGRGGELQYRGMLLESDINRTDAGVALLATPANFGHPAHAENTLLGELDNPLPTGSFVMPRAPKEQQYPAKLVVSHEYGGLRHIQPSRTRTTIETDEVKLAQRKLNAFANRINRLRNQVANGILTGQLLLQAQSIFDAALMFLNSLTALIRGALKIPDLLRIRP